MKNWRFWVVTLALVLVFGMTVISCDDGDQGAIVATSSPFTNSATGGTGVSGGTGGSGGFGGGGTPVPPPFPPVPPGSGTGGSGSSDGDSGIGGGSTPSPWWWYGQTYYTVTDGTVTGIDYLYNVNYTRFVNDRDFSYEYSYTSAPPASATSGSGQITVTFSQSGDNTSWTSNTIQNYSIVAATYTSTVEQTYNQLLYRTGNTETQTIDMTTRTILSYTNSALTDSDTTTSSLTTSNILYDAETGLELQRNTSITSITNNGTPIVVNTTTNYIHKILSRDANTVTVKYHNETDAAYSIRVIRINDIKAQLEYHSYSADGTLISSSNFYDLSDIDLRPHPHASYLNSSNLEIEILSRTETLLEYRVKFFDKNGVLSSQYDNRFRITP